MANAEENELREFYDLFMQGLVGMRMSTQGQSFFGEAIREIGYEPYELKTLLDERKNWGNTFDEFKKKMCDRDPNQARAVREAWTVFATVDEKTKDFIVDMEKMEDLLNTENPYNPYKDMLKGPPIFKGKCKVLLKRADRQAATLETKGKKEKEKQKGKKEQPSGASQPLLKNDAELLMTALQLKRVDDKEQWW